MGRGRVRSGPRIRRPGRVGPHPSAPSGRDTDMARIILITGANRGIGRELAAQLAADGDTVLLSARNGDAAARAAAEIGGDVHPIQLDVSDPASIEAATKKIEAEHGHLDVLVNNVGGVFDYAQQASTADLGVVQEALELNLFSTWRVTQAVLPLLRNAQGARIVNVSSEAAITGTHGGGHSRLQRLQSGSQRADPFAGGRARRARDHRSLREPRLDGHRSRWRGRPPHRRGRGQHQARRQPARRGGHRRVTTRTSRSCPGKTPIRRVGAAECGPDPAPSGQQSAIHAAEPLPPRRRPSFPRSCQPGANRSESTMGRQCPGWRVVVQSAAPS